MLAFFAFGHVIFACFVISATAKATVKKASSSQPKYENVYNRTRLHDIALPDIPGAGDFLQSTVTSLASLKNGTAVSPEKLNHISDGLNQYYLSKAYEYYFADVKQSNESHTDPVRMPNVTSENVEFSRVEIYGFPGLKKNARIRQSIDASPFVKNYTMHFNATSAVTIINGDFKIDDNERYYFVYHTYNNVYTSRVDVIRTTNGLLKPKSTVESFAAQKEIFVHTYDVTQEHYAKVNASLYPKFRKVLREMCMPKLASFVEDTLGPSFSNANTEFGRVYRSKLRETLLKSANEYLRALGHVTHEFSPQYMTAETGIPGFAPVYTYTAKVAGYLNYDKYIFNSTQSEANGTLLFMNDMVTLHYPPHVCNMSIIVVDHKNASYDELFEITSVDVWIAYTASLSSVPIRVHRDLDKWASVRTGFLSKFHFEKINPFYHFMASHAQREFAKLIDTLFEADSASDD